MKKRQLIQDKESSDSAKKARKLGMGNSKSSGTPAPGSSRPVRKKKQTVRADKGHIPALPKRPKEKRKAESRNTEKKKAQTDHTTEKQCACGTCGGVYGDVFDKQVGDDWLQCASCNLWFHETCAEECGLVDVDEFICGSCYQS